MKVLLFKGRGIISTLIRWQTRSQYSHAAILLPDGETIIEAWQGDGVRVKKMTDWSNVDAFDVAGITPEQCEKAIAYARSKVGNGYDYLGVLRFISRRKTKDNNREFCSELVFASLLDAGIALLSRILPGAVSPGHLGISPILIYRPRI